MNNTIASMKGAGVVNDYERVSDFIIGVMDNPTAILLGGETCLNCGLCWHFSVAHGYCKRHNVDGILFTDFCEDFAQKNLVVVPLTANEQSEIAKRLDSKREDTDGLISSWDGSFISIATHSTASNRAMSHLTKLVWKSSSLIPDRKIVIDDESEDSDEQGILYEPSWYSVTDDGALIPFIETTVVRRDNQKNEYLVNVWIPSPSVMARIRTSIPAFDGDGVVTGATEYLEARLRREGKSCKAIDDALSVAHKRIRAQDGDFTEAYEISRRLALDGASEEEIDKHVQRALGVSEEYRLPQSWYGQELVREQPENADEVTTASTLVEMLQRQWGSDRN